MKDNAVFAGNAKFSDTNKVKDNKNYSESKTFAETSAISDNDAPTKKEKKKVKISPTSLSAAFIAVVVAVVTIIVPTAGGAAKPAPLLVDFEVGYENVAYAVDVQDDALDKYRAMVYNSTYKAEKKLEGKHSEGKFLNLKPKTVYTFELVFKGEFGDSSLIKRQFKTNSQPPVLFPPDMVRGKIESVELRNDYATQKFYFDIVLNDPNNLLHNFKAVLVSEKTGEIYNISLSQNIAETQSYSYAAISGGVYSLIIQADSGHPNDTDAVTLVNKIRI